MSALDLNIPKPTLLSLFSSSTPPPLHIGGAILPYSRSASHLGHPITCPLTPTNVAQEALRLLTENINHFISSPLPFPARLELTRKILLPSFLYQVECVATPPAILIRAHRMLRSFLFAVRGVPAFSNSLLCDRWLGLGLPYLPTVAPSRFLDNMHKARGIIPFSPSPSAICPVANFRSAALFLKASTAHSRPLFHTPPPCDNVPPLRLSSNPLPHPVFPLPTPRNLH
jgi:hypothetical protein